MNKVVQQILPENVAAHVARSTPATFALLRAEERCCTRFSAKRLEEFRGGRYCASEALRQLGLDRTAIPVGSARQPLWPDETTGSITHTRDLAGAVAAFSDEYKAIGLDFEQMQSMDDIDKEISSERERREAGKVLPDDQLLAVLFSGKESVYKCLWPIVRRFISFHEIELTLTREAKESGQFRVRHFDDSLRPAQHIEGRWIISEDILMTVAYIANNH